MHFLESETVELKEVVVDDIKKEILAFANCQGGTLYIGVNDEGTPVGVANADQVVQQISNQIRDAVKPDVTMFVHYNIIEQDGKLIVKVQVQRGTNRPYYLSKKGLRPEGVYVRQGTSSVPATDTAIRQMIKETDGDSFEEMRSLKQDLTFEAARKEFVSRGMEFETLQMKTLKLFKQDGIYTNLGLLLSDQCVHTIKAAVFEGTDQNVFKDRREFSGSLLQQLNDVYSYINFHNQIRSTFDHLLRIDTKDYPEVAMREALLNLLVHRDYSFRASGLISIYVDRIEFVSVGGLLPGISLDDIMTGLSVCRNQNLANVFYRLQLIEAYGTGIRKIQNAYKGNAVQPKFEVTSNAFKVLLPNRNASTLSTEPLFSVGNEEEAVLELVKKQGIVIRADIETQLGVSTSTASRLLRSMVKKGILVQRGKGRNTSYMLR